MDSLTWLNDLIYPMMVVVQTIPTTSHIAPYPGFVARLWDSAQDCLDYLDDNLPIIVRAFWMVLGIVTRIC